MSGRSGRDQTHSHSRRDYNNNNQRNYHHSSSSSSSSSRFDDNNNKSSRGKNKTNSDPSRHLWVGNLSQYITQSSLSDEFGRFGSLESVAFNPGRSYAFVNFLRQDDAIAAFNTLQGFTLAGMPLRIEFAKSDKSSAPSRDESYLQHRDELKPRNRCTAISPREPRKRHASPDVYFPGSPRTNDHQTDYPTEILWIGFPACLKVDESILRKAFSPFGDIDKITAFPGRTYAFVQFRNLASACRAKETLQGKLFGNPRVHISFAKKEHASSGSGRRNMRHNAPPSPQFKSFQVGSSDSLRTNQNFKKHEDASLKAPHFSNMGFGDPDDMSFSRLESPWTHTGGQYEDRGFHEREPDVGPLQLGYRSPLRDGNDRINNFSCHKFQRAPFPEAPREVEDIYSHRGIHGGKKLKINSFGHEELPEYPLYDVEQHKHAFPSSVPEFPLSDESRPTLPHRSLTEKPTNFNQSLQDKHDIWRLSHDTFQSPPPTSVSIPIEWKRTIPELCQPGPKEWKWEGTIAKGGTPVCQARCFPVGKVMDFFLPEFLDCTARTGLDMLAKHYYQATCCWVVFFVAASDADMGYYNEFMHYLGEKQRAAVAKLDESKTLFLVPPSDFSQNVLKVPGKLSISGVVLSLESASPVSAPLPQENEMKDRSLVYSHVDTSYIKSQLPSGTSPLPVTYLNLEKSGLNSGSVQGNMKNSAPSYGHESESVPYQIEDRHDFQSGHTVHRDSTLHALAVSQECSNFNSSTGGAEFGRVNYDGGIYSGGSKPSSAPHLPLDGFQQQQHAASEVYRPSGLIGNQHETMLRVPLRYNAPKNTNQFPGLSPSSFGQLQQQAENIQAYSQTAPNRTQVSQDVNVGIPQDDGETDPQKRLQATLQLAAALLQQIQQGKAP